MRSRIFTVPRYLYLNLYALLLLIGGVVALVIPIGEGVIWFIILKGTICLICFKGVYGILASWPDKKRKYNILITRNQELFRPETFKEYMEAPCGRLLVKVVLRDLGLSHEYPSLGDLVRQGKDNLQAPWIGISIFIVLSSLLTMLIFIGEGIRDAFDARRVR